MDELTRRLSLARKALRTLHEILAERPSAIVRDAAIQRFEYTFETAWKAGQRYLKQVEGLDLASPNAVIRGSHAVGLFDEHAARSALQMVADRNLTVHTYNEALAESIFGRLPRYAALAERWLAAMEAGSKAQP